MSNNQGRKNKSRPPKHIREKCKFRCGNKKCGVELLGAEEKINGYCHKCSLIPKFKRKIEARFKN